MEGWGGYPEDLGERQTTEATSRQRLIRRRDDLLRELDALRNKVAGLEIAMKIISDEIDT